jgi:hypothetical protein
MFNSVLPPPHPPVVAMKNAVFWDINTKFKPYRKHYVKVKLSP